MKHFIRLQFNAYMMITIKGIVRYRRKQRTKRLGREVLFCEIPLKGMNKKAIIKVPKSKKNAYKKLLRQKKTGLSKTAKIK